MCAGRGCVVAYFAARHGYNGDYCCNGIGDVLCCRCASEAPGVFGAIGAAGLAVLMKLTSYRADRFTTFLHPELDPQGVGYHINQALLAIGSGGLFGRGYGHSLQKFQYLPEVAGDSIFAVMSEELGFVFIVAFLALYTVFIFRGLKSPTVRPTRLAVIWSLELWCGLVCRQL